MISDVASLYHRIASTYKMMICVSLHIELPSYYHTLFQAPRVSDASNASTSHTCTSAILLLLRVRNWRITVRVLQWHNTLTNFIKICQLIGKLKWGTLRQTNTCTHTHLRELKKPAFSHKEGKWAGSIYVSIMAASHIELRVKPTPETCLWNIPWTVDSNKYHSGIHFELAIQAVNCISIEFTDSFKMHNYLIYNLSLCCHKHEYLF
jgi:hypothetical protein